MTLLRLFAKLLLEILEWPREAWPDAGFGRIVLYGNPNQAASGFAESQLLDGPKTSITSLDVGTGTPFRGGQFP
ncbi:MAG: hypothetical protein RIC14_04690 [Filomicrobium sp.]